MAEIPSFFPSFLSSNPSSPTGNGLLSSISKSKLKRRLIACLSKLDVEEKFLIYLVTGSGYHEMDRKGWALLFSSLASFFHTTLALGQSLLQGFVQLETKSELEWKRGSGKNERGRLTGHFLLCFTLCLPILFAFRPFHNRELLHSDLVVQLKSSQTSSKASHFFSLIQSRAQVLLVLGSLLTPMLFCKTASFVVFHQTMSTRKVCQKTGYLLIHLPHLMQQKNRVTWWIKNFYFIWKTGLSYISQKQWDL